MKYSSVLPAEGIPHYFLPIPYKLDLLGLHIWRYIISRELALALASLLASIAWGWNTHFWGKLCICYKVTSTWFGSRCLGNSGWNVITASKYLYSGGELFSSCTTETPTGTGWQRCSGMKIWGFKLTVMPLDFNSYRTNLLWCPGVVGTYHVSPSCGLNIVRECRWLGLI